MIQKVSINAPMFFGEQLLKMVFKLLYFNIMCAELPRYKK